MKAIEIINNSGDRKICSRKCSVYGDGLSRQLLLTLARQHNDFNGIQRYTTFSEIAASCRRLLFLHFGDDEDDGNYMPTIPTTTLRHTRTSNMSASPISPPHAW